MIPLIWHLQAAVITIPRYDGHNPTHAFLMHVLTVVRMLRVLRLPRLLQVPAETNPLLPGQHGCCAVVSLPFCFRYSCRPEEMHVSSSMLLLQMLQHIHISTNALSEP